MPFAGNVMRAFAAAVVLAAFAVASVPALAQEFNLVIRNHKFEPAEIAFRRQACVDLREQRGCHPRGIRQHRAQGREGHPGKSKGLVRIGPLDPGRYEFIGEFHADTAKAS